MTKNSQGWVKIVIICLFVFAILVIAGGYVGYRKLKEKAPQIIARMIEISADGVFVQIQLPEAERGSAMSAIRSLTQDIREGKVNLQQGKRIAKALNDKALIGAIIIRSFESQYVHLSSLKDSEKTDAHQTLTRFVHGVIDGKIPRESLDAVLNMISEEQGNSNGNRRLKNSISEEELKDVLLNMKDAADHAQIENRTYEIDIAEIIREAIKKGMTENREAEYKPRDLSFCISRTQRGRMIPFIPLRRMDKVAV